MEKTLGEKQSAGIGGEIGHVLRRIRRRDAETWMQRADCVEDLAGRV